MKVNKHGEPHDQDVKLKLFLCEKGYASLPVEIVQSIVECFNKHYGNTM